jgi:hypothetical protein
VERHADTKSEFYDGEILAILVSQNEPRIEQFIRTEANQWLLQEPPD